MYIHITDVIHTGIRVCVCVYKTLILVAKHMDFRRRPLQPLRSQAGRLASVSPRWLPCGVAVGTVPYSSSSFKN